MDFSEIISKSRQDLEGKWGLVIITLFVYAVVSFAGSLIPLGSLIVGGPLMVGVAIFKLSIVRNENAQLEQIFSGFNNFGNTLAAYIIGLLLILAGTILFIIPGIILMLGLSQTMFILADNPSLPPTEALRKSWDMMDGHKGDLFVLALIFFLLTILSALTLFIGLIWLIPVMNMAYTNFYLNLRGEETPEYAINEDVLDA